MPPKRHSFPFTNDPPPSQPRRNSIAYEPLHLLNAYDEILASLEQINISSPTINFTDAEIFFRHVRFFITHKEIILNKHQTRVDYLYQNEFPGSPLIHTYDRSGRAVSFDMQIFSTSLNNQVLQVINAWKEAKQQNRLLEFFRDLPSAGGCLDGRIRLFIDWYTRHFIFINKTFDDIMGSLFNEYKRKNFLGAEALGDQPHCVQVKDEVEMGNQNNKYIWIRDRYILLPSAYEYTYYILRQYDGVRCPENNQSQELVTIDYVRVKRYLIDILVFYEDKNFAFEKPFRIQPLGERLPTIEDFLQVNLAVSERECLVEACKDNLLPLTNIHHRTAAELRLLVSPHILYAIRAGFFKREWLEGSVLPIDKLIEINSYEAILKQCQQKRAGILISRSVNFDAIKNSLQEKHNLIRSLEDQLSKSQKTIAAGVNYSAIISPYRQLWVCGGNDSGQLGLANPNTQISKKFQLLGEAFISVAAGFDHTVALNETGTLYVCGSNEWCKLGIGNNFHTFIEFQPVKLGVSNIKFASVAAGELHTVALSNMGKLFVCGNNNFGQLGFNDFNPRITFEKVTHNVDNITFVAASAGHDHTIALSNDGKLFICGKSRGSLPIPLGVHDLHYTHGFKEVIVESPNAEDVTFASVASTRWHSIALSTNGKLFHNIETHNNVFRPYTRGVESVTFNAIAAKESVFMAISNNGKLFKGKLHTILRLPWQDRISLIEVTDENINDIILTDVAVGSDHAIVRSNDGKIFVWGENLSGQLGLGHDRDLNNFQENTDLQNLFYGRPRFAWREG